MERNSFDGRFDALGARALGISSLVSLMTTSASLSLGVFLSSFVVVSCVFVFVCVVVSGGIVGSRAGLVGGVGCFSR